jgi:hypothetical protein
MLNSLVRILATHIWAYIDTNASSSIQYMLMHQMFKFVFLVKVADPCIDDM